MRRTLLAAAGAAGLVVVSAAAAQAGTGGEHPPAGVVSASPAAGTPHLPATSSSTQQIRQLVQCGGTMYAVGTFSSIQQGGKTYARTDIFSFQASSPYTVTSWAPAVVGSPPFVSPVTEILSSAPGAVPTLLIATVGPAM